MKIFNMPLYKYIEIIHKQIDSKLPLGIGEVPYERTELPMSCINIDELVKDTGFVPKVRFEEGIARVISTAKKERENGK